MTVASIGMGIFDEHAMLTYTSMREIVAIVETYDLGPNTTSKFFRMPRLKGLDQTYMARIMSEYTRPIQRSSK